MAVERKTVGTLQKMVLISLVALSVPVPIAGNTNQPFYVRQYRPTIPWSLYLGSVDLVSHYTSLEVDPLLYGFELLTVGVQEHIFGFGAAITPFRMLDTFGEYDPPETVPSSVRSFLTTTVSWSPFTPVPFRQRRTFQPSVFLQFVPWRFFDGPIAAHRSEDPALRYGVGIMSGSLLTDSGPFGSLGLQTAIGFPLSLQILYSRDEGIALEGRVAVSVMYTDRTPGYDIMVDSIYELTRVNRDPEHAPEYVETKEAQRGVRSLPVEMVRLSDASRPTAGETLNVAPPSYHLSVYPISIEQFIEVMGYEPPGRANANSPLSSAVVHVSWIDAVTFCNRLSAIEGYMPAYTIDGNTVVWDERSDGYRLPVESEWENAALISVNDDTSDLTQTPTNFAGTETTQRWFWEWVWDEYRPARKTEDGRFLIGNDNLRVRRGGPSPTYRGYAAATQRGPVVGFRVARSRVDTVLNP